MRNLDVDVVYKSFVEFMLMETTIEVDTDGLFSLKYEVLSSRLNLEKVEVFALGGRGR